MSEVTDPKEPDTQEMLTLLLVQQMRTYDALMHILDHFDPEVAQALHETHKNHELWGPLPFIQIEK